MPNNNKGNVITLRRNVNNTDTCLSNLQNDEWVLFDLIIFRIESEYQEDVNE